jgi:hypothetical protein
MEMNKEIAATEGSAEMNKSSAPSDVLAFVLGIGFVLLAWAALVVLRLLL